MPSLLLLLLPLLLLLLLSVLNILLLLVLLALVLVGWHGTVVAWDLARACQVSSGLLHLCHQLRQCRAGHVVW